MTLTLDQIHLASGSHDAPGVEMCVMEAAAYIAGEPHSDHPACVCPTLATFLRAWNDDLPDDDRQKLKPYVTRIVGTAGDGNAERRAWMALDWLTRTCTPVWLDLAGLSDHAAALRDASLATGAFARDAAWARCLGRCRGRCLGPLPGTVPGTLPGAAAWDGANRTLRPVPQLQQSAFGLLDRMIDLPRRAGGA